MYRRISVGVLIAADAAALALDVPDFAALWLHVRAPRAWLDAAGTDAALAAVAAALLWCAAAWLALGLLAMPAARLPGIPGRLAVVVSRRLLPRAVAAALAGTAGLGVLLTPAVAGAASPPAAPPSPSTATADATSLPAPTWPVTPVAPATPTPDDGARHAPPAAGHASPVAGRASPVAGRASPTAHDGPAVASHRPSAPPLPVPTWPSDQVPSGPDPSSAQPGTTAPAPGGSPASRSARDAPGQPGTGPVNSPRPTQPDAARVRVRPGDSLWLIAARRLGAHAGPTHIAVEWPRWYAANREVIGPDPDLIRPGQVLVEPRREAQR